MSEVSSPDGRVRIIAPFYKNNYIKKVLQKSDISGIQVPSLPRSDRISKFLNGIVSPVLLRSFNPDIIHETYYGRSFWIPKKAKKILTVYDMIHEIFPTNFGNKDNISFLKKSAVQLADHIICISDNTKKDLINILDVECSKISVVHLGFTLTESKNSTNLSLPRPYLLYVGSRRSYKNFHRFFSAYASSDQLSKHFDVVCFGGGNFDLQELDFFNSLKISSDKIHQLSGDDAVLSQLYQGAVVFVYPSLYEGFGLPPLEAMSYGCAVACSGTSSIPEVVGKAAIMFDPSDQDSIRSALEKVCFDTALREMLVKLGFERIKNFSWRKCAIETHNVYKKILS